MKTFLRILCSLLFCFSLAESKAQSCDAGYSNATLNWDLMKFLKTETYVTTAMETNQNFAFGKSSMNLSFSGVTAVGETKNQTGKTGSFAEGADIEFSGNGTITLTFPYPVYNLRFSIQDVERGQRFDLSASNSGVAQAVALTTSASSGSFLTINSTSVTNPYVISLSGGGQTGTVANTSNIGSFNVTIVGPVTTVNIISSNNTDNTDFFLSDIHACVNGVFTSNYYEISRPFANQPGSVLVAINSSVYSVETSTGKAKLVFSDGATSGSINSLAYDPYNKIIYYCWSLTNMGSANASERTLRKYDFNTGTSTTVVSDIRTLGVPTFFQGVESGAAAFFDGSLYLGIEGGSTSDDVKTSGGGPNKTATGKKSIIWRIDFNNSLAPIRASQVYSVAGDTHDWSDFSVSNAVLYDFNGDAGNEDYNHIDLVTGNKQWFNDVGVTPKQSAVGWDGTVFWVSDQIGQYNLNGTVGIRYNISSTPTIPNWSNSTAPSFGDAAEAFRPRADFGDAPASYDPDPLAPALHEQDANLRFGTNLSVEWNKMSTTNTDTDDDGLYFVPILNQGGGVYQTTVKVFNNTGAPATVGGWMDFNGDGVFQEGEGVITTVGTSTVSQDISLYWTGIAQNMPNNTSTYLRIRITSATNNMTKASFNGYLANGEVEDWLVLVNTTTLAVNFKSFSAEQSGSSKVKLSWQVTNETGNTIYEIQKSKDGINWHATSAIKAFGKEQKVTYSFVDVLPYQPTNYYRIKYKEPGTTEKFSVVQQVTFEKPSVLGIYPNPAQDQVTLTVEAARQEIVQLNVVDLNGKTIISKGVELKKGSNSFSIPVYHLPDGIYYVQVYLGDRQYIQKLIVKKK